MRQTPLSGAILILYVFLASALAACSISPLANEDRQASVMDDLNFEVPKDRPVTRKDDPIDIGTPAAGSQLTQPIIVPGTGGTRQAAGGPAPDEGEAIYRVNFDNADLREAVGSILGTTLGLDYLIDPRVSGSITLGTTKPVTARGLLTMLDFALQMNGAALIHDGQIVRVVPEDVAKSSGMQLNTESMAGYGITVFPLQYAAAGSVARTMAAVFTAEGAVVADERSNSLILTGNAEQRQGMIELASSFDVDWMSGKSIGLFPLRNAQPDPVARELETVFADAIGDVPTAFVRFLPITRLSAVMVIAGDASQLVQAQAWIERLDRGNQSERSLRVYYVKNGKAVDLANTLTRVFTGVAPPAPGLGSGPASAPARTSDVTTETLGNAFTTDGYVRSTDLGSDAIEEEQADVTSATTDVVPEENVVEPAPVPGAATTGATGPPSALRVIADSANNSLLIMATPAEHEAIEKALQRLDILPMQVLIEATIAEVTLNDELKYGVEYYFNNNNNVRGAARGTGLSIAGIGSLLTTGVAPGLNLLIDTGSGPDVVITALSALTDVKVISSPQVVVQDNRTALLKVGDQVPVTIQQAVSIVTPDAPVVNSIQYVDTGVILKVTPRVNSGGLVTCDVEQEVSSVSSDSLTGVLTPTISIRKIKSTVSVQSGQTVALGGLISESRNDNTTGLPGLSRVPVIGALFGTKDQGINRTELIVFITPRVIGSSEEARDVTLELRSRLRSLRQPPSAAPQPGNTPQIPETPAPPPTPETPAPPAPDE